MRVIIIKVMNDAVAELCRKDLSFLRVADDKAGGRAGLVGACPEFQTEFGQVVFEASFKLHYVRLLAFVPSGIVISLMKILKEFGVS